MWDWRAGTSKRVADVLHPRLEFGDEGGQILACHGGSLKEGAA